MRLTPVLAALALPALFAACDPSNRLKDEVVAAATIGPAGGELEVTTGLYAGLRLTVPAGALTSDLAVVMVKPAPPPPGTAQPAVIGGPGPFVRIDPPWGAFLVPATLRLPYRVASAMLSGPGNVRAMHVSATGPQFLEPDVVDAVLGRVEVHIGSLGGFQVVHAPPAQLHEYLGAPGTTVPLEDGYSFTFDEPVSVPHLENRPIQRWTIDTGVAEQAVYLEEWKLAGRADPTAGWQEVWNTPLQVLLPEANTLTPPAMSTTWIWSPITATTPIPGRVDLLARFLFDVPLQIGSRQFRDVLRFRLLLTWQRPDLGTGSSEQVYWFAPGVGLIQVQLDGVIRSRTDL